jgi:hypothetical protein
MQVVAVGRKNWMFAGSDAGACRVATIYSLVCTCSLLGVEPNAYLEDVLQRIVEGDHPALYSRAVGRPSELELRRAEPRW